MKWTFGICISPDTNPGYLNQLVNSIWDECANYFLQTQIILIGGLNEYTGRLIFGGDNPLMDSRVDYIPFNENNKKGWITAKKNIIAKCAEHKNLCILHDYYKIERGFAQAIDDFDTKTPDWKIIVPRIQTNKGDRHSDWLLDSDVLESVIRKIPRIGERLMEVAPHENASKYVCGLPYDETRLRGLQYISGGAIICKSDVILDVPLPENLVWGEKEDIEWSKDVMNKNYYKQLYMVPEAVLSVQKPNKWAVTQMPDDVVQELVRMYGEYGDE